LLAVDRVERRYASGAVELAAIGLFACDTELRAFRRRGEVLPVVGLLSFERAIVLRTTSDGKHCEYEAARDEQ
jgi:hypothetical protein